MIKCISFYDFYRMNFTRSWHNEICLINQFLNFSRCYWRFWNEAYVMFISSLSPLSWPLVCVWLWCNISIFFRPLSLTLICLPHCFLDTMLKTFARSKYKLITRKNIVKHQTIQSRFVNLFMLNIIFLLSFFWQAGSLFLGNLLYVFIWLVGS